MKRALVIVDGIRTNPGIRQDIKNSKFPTLRYEKIIRAKTEEVFDTTIPWYIRWVPFVNNWYDQYLSDVLALFKNKTARMAACREVRSTIKILQAEGYEVDVLAYSLGTLIALTCASQSDDEKTRIGTLSLFNSPLGFAVPYLGFRCRSFVRKYGKNLSAENLKCVYGAKDIVSKNCLKKAKDIIDGFSIEPPIYRQTQEKHDLVANINACYK